MTMGGNFDALGRMIKVALLILAIIAGLILLGAALAKCAQEDCLVMEAHNLRVAENVLELLGHQIKAYDGVAIGPEEKRAQGTALVILRGHNPQGQWFCFALECDQGAIKAPVKVYPLKRPPVGWKGD